MKNIKLIHTSPIYPNKWRFYILPFSQKSDESSFRNSNINKSDVSNFNWFLCGRPYTDEKGNKVVDIGRYVSFFDLSSGKSYHITYDVIEDYGKCLVKIINNKDTINEEALIAIKENYRGVAYLGEATKDCSCDLICENAEITFDSRVIEESKKCPYIDFALSHYLYCKEKTSDFPSKEEIIKSNCGEMSLKLRKIMLNLF